jgi:hypothetical protein
MPCEKHGKYLIVTKADYDVEKKSWHPYAHISWIEGKKFHFQQLRDLNKTFLLREGAEFYGLVVGRAWIQNQVRAPAGSLALVESHRERPARKRGMSK